MTKDGERPFSLKHAQQQASIVGNMQEEGLADRLPSAAILEVGIPVGLSRPPSSNVDNEEDDHDDPDDVVDDDHDHEQTVLPH